MKDNTKTAIEIEWDVENSLYQCKPEKKTIGTVPCFNCGKPVTVMLPFLGCVYCVDCLNPVTGTYVYQEEF